MTARVKPNLDRYIAFAKIFQEVMENGAVEDKEKIMARHSYWANRLQSRNVKASDVAKAEAAAGIKEEFRIFC